MIKGFVLYTEEEVKRFITEINKLIAVAADGRFNAEANPREACKTLHEELKIINYHIEHGYDTFANRSSVPVNLTDAHFK